MRSPSGVTMMKERAVAGPSAAATESKLHTLCPHVMTIDVAQLVGFHFPKIGGFSAIGCYTRRRVARRATRNLDRLPHVGIEHFGTLFIDQVHGTLHQPVLLDETIRHAGDDIDNGIADGENVEGRLCHGNSKFAPPPLAHAPCAGKALTLAV